MKKYLISWMAFLLSQVISGQTDTLKLDECLNIAGSRSVLNRQKDNSEEILTRKIRNLNNNWFPSVGLNAQAVYNSETIDFSDVFGNMGSVPSLPLDQYKVWADINQQIFDGGTVKAMKQVEQSSYESELQQTGAELLSVKQQVSQVYFSLLLADKNAEVLGISLGDLSQRREALKAGVTYGVVLPENLLALEAEEISLKQKILELSMLREQLIKVIFILMDSTLSGNIVIVEPDEPVAGGSGMRPEIKMFDSQQARLSANQKLISLSDYPKIFAFSQLAWGRPGYNMISRDFHTFYTVGAGMKWNFLNYGDTKRQKEILEIQKDLIEIKRTNFNNQLNIQLQTEITNMAKYDSLMKQDETILRIRKAIAESGLSKFKNGIITSAEYISDMNAEILANLQYENHKILRKQAAYNYLLINGQL